LEGSHHAFEVSIFPLSSKTVPISSRVIRNEIEKTTVAEEQRLLYVALTRAEEKLVLMCDGESFYKKLEKYCSELDV
jgi:ATP-dependent exoDNAse (exonuclease V) beta subunit